MEASATGRVIGKAYSEDFWSRWPEVFEDLCAKLENPSHPVSQEKVNNIFRAVLAIGYLRANLHPGAAILDAACGIGYNAACLARSGFRVCAFDISEVGIQRSKELALQLGLDPDMFTHADHTYLERVSDQSQDAVIAMGLLRYVDAPTRDYCYRQFARILKKGGRFLLTNQNLLFETFALNEDSLRFWAKMMEDFSPVAGLMGPRGLLGRLREKVQVPPRRWRQGSISRSYETNAQNPLTYRQVVEPYGFTVEKIAYPDCHLLPPMLEAEVDPEALMKLKAETCVQKSEDWRGMFMDYEFMAFLRRT